VRRRSPSNCGGYQLQFKTNLTQTNWSNLGVPITETNSSLNASDPINANPQRYYRVKLLP